MICKDASFIREGNEEYYTIRLESFCEQVNVDGILEDKMCIRDRTAAMLGVGSSVPGHPPDWKIARSIVLTWLLTFPGCGVIGYFMARIFLSFL